METGHFYFIKDQYFIDFPDENLMKNKVTINGVLHRRPCFYAFEDSNYAGLYWLIPFSSRVAKFEGLYNQKVSKRGYCDTIVFGDVLGYRKAFLIQNMCPVTLPYIENEYMNNNTPVAIERTKQDEIISKAKKVLALQNNGVNLIFPDVLSIKNNLINTLT